MTSPDENYLARIIFLWKKKQNTITGDNNKKNNCEVFYVTCILICS